MDQNDLHTTAARCLAGKDGNYYAAAALLSQHSGQSWVDAYQTIAEVARTTDLATVAEPIKLSPRDQEIADLCMELADGAADATTIAMALRDELGVSDFNQCMALGREWEGKASAERRRFLKTAGFNEKQLAGLSEAERVRLCESALSREGTRRLRQVAADGGSVLEPGAPMIRVSR